jgi:hypothetical protein
MHLIATTLAGSPPRPSRIRGLRPLLGRSRWALRAALRP